MKKKISREELIEKRKKWQAQREMNLNLTRDLKAAHYEEEERYRLQKNTNPYMIGAINFFSTLFMGIILVRFFLFALRIATGFPTSDIFAILGPLVFAAAVISIFIKKPIFTKVFEKVVEIVGLMFRGY